MTPIATSDRSVGSIPELPGWRDRNPFLTRHGSLTVRRYDLDAEALAKLECGHRLDEVDVAEMPRPGLIEAERLQESRHRRRLDR